jgi:hypothetical protein
VAFIENVKDDTFVGIFWQIYILLFPVALSVCSETSWITFLGCDKVLTEENPAG